MEQSDEACVLMSINGASFRMIAIAYGEGAFQWLNEQMSDYDADAQKYLHVFESVPLYYLKGD